MTKKWFDTQNDINLTEKLQSVALEMTHQDLPEFKDKKGLNIQDLVKGIVITTKRHDYIQGGIECHNYHTIIEDSNHPAPGLRPPSNKLITCVTSDKYGNALRAHYRIKQFFEEGE